MLVTISEAGTKDKKDSMKRAKKIPDKFATTSIISQLRPMKLCTISSIEP